MDVAGGTHLSNSLKQLEKLAIDQVSVTGSDGLTVSLGDESLGAAVAGGLPHFDGAPVTLEMSAADLTNEIGNLGVEGLALSSHGISEIQVDLAAPDTNEIGRAHV